MRTTDLAEKMVSAKNSSERKRLLKRHKTLANLRLARRLKEICYSAWTSEPTKAQRSALALRDLVSVNPKGEIGAYASWVAGISSVTKGSLEQAIENFDSAADSFRKVGNEHDATQTQVAKLMALALLGRYEDAVVTAKSALKIFRRLGDELAAGKIEMNLANMFSRREMHAESKKYGLSAQRRFAVIGEKRWQTMAENGLAITFAQLNDFRSAEAYYRQALQTAKAADMIVTEAEIEASMGNLALMRGDYAGALRCLELSRQKYEQLKMPHGRTVAELEIADIYAQLNLANEAFEIYARVSPVLKKLKLRREEARARTGLGRSAATLGKHNVARREFVKGAGLYTDEGNAIGAAIAKTELAFLEVSRGESEPALQILAEVEDILRSSENPRHALIADLLRSETFVRLGKSGIAEGLLESVGERAEKYEYRPVLQSALNLLGKISAVMGESKKAEAYFLKSIALIEQTRGEIAADEFRIALLSTNLQPFDNLLDLYLQKCDLEKAFAVTERSRSRSLTDSMSSAGLAIYSKDAPKRLTEKVAALREELNWYYSRSNRASTAEIDEIARETRKREKALTDLLRQIDSIASSDRGGRRSDEFSLKKLQKQLGPNRVLIEYVNGRESFSAFVVTESDLTFVSDLAAEDVIDRLRGDLHFQFSGMRYGKKLPAAFERQLKTRADLVLKKLHEKLIAPLQNLTGARELVIVPAGTLNYLPFQSFHDGAGYLIERHRVTYAPSAAVWQTLDARSPRRIRKALFVGFANERIPQVNDEVRDLAAMYPNSKKLIGSDATFAAFKTEAPKYDLLHIACHGQFRADNPMFSSLHLADGWITVRDIYAQRLKASLVTLSACETGLNQVSAGEEILGLTRGFLSAGADSLVLSLWTVNDEATREIMRDLYSELRSGTAASESLRRAQIEQIRKNRHPYLWSPFIYVGR